MQKRPPIHFFWVALLAVLPAFLMAQTELSEKDKRKFDHYFFEGQRLKNIGRTESAIKAFEECYKIDAQNSTTLFELGKLYAANQQFAKAQEYLETAHQIDPANNWIALELAKTYETQKLLPEATDIYVDLTQLKPQNVNYKFQLAQLYFNQRQYKACLKVLDDIETLTGISEELSQQKKDIYLLQSDIKGAQRELEKLVEAFPANIEYKGQLAQFYSANGMTKKAIATYQEMLIASPDDPRAHLDLANLYKQQGDFETSYEHLKKAVSNPSLNIDLKIKVLYQLFTLTETDSTLLPMAKDLLEKSIAASPNEPKIHTMNGDFLLRENDIKGARNAYRKATRLGAHQRQIWSQIMFLDAQIGDADSLAADGEDFIEIFPNEPLAYLMSGSGFLQLEKYQKAAELLEAGLDFVIDNSQLEEQLYISLADAYHRLNQHIKSDQYFDKALAINPRDPSVLNNYAYYLSERGARLNKALEMTQKSNELSPNNGVFLDTWAWVLFKMGKYNQALEKIELCAQNGGANSGEVLEHWGDILYKLKRTDEAVAKWKEAAQKPDASENIHKKIETQQLYE